MNTRVKQFGMAWLITKRELMDQMRDWRVLVPMIVLTAFFPYLMTVAAQTAIDYLNQFGGSVIVYEDDCSVFFLFRLRFVRCRRGWFGWTVAFFFRFILRIPGRH